MRTYWLPRHLVQGTAMVAVVPGVLTSAASHLAAGHVPLGLAAAATGGALCGAALGARAGLQLSEDELRALYMASLVVLGGRSVVGALQNVASLARRRRGG